MTYIPMGPVVKQYVFILSKGVHRIPISHKASTVFQLPGSGPYLPVWQFTPVTPTKGLINFNVLSHPAAAGAYKAVIDTGKAVIDFAGNLYVDSTTPFLGVILLSLTKRLFLHCSNRNEENLGSTGA